VIYRKWRTFLGTNVKIRREKIRQKLSVSRFFLISQKKNEFFISPYKVGHLKIQGGSYVWFNWKRMPIATLGCSWTHIWKLYLHEKNKDLWKKGQRTRERGILRPGSRRTSRRVYIHSPLVRAIWQVTINSQWIAARPSFPSLKGWHKTKSFMGCNQ